MSLASAPAVVSRHPHVPPPFPLLLILLLLAACRSAPDLAPFAHASRELTASVRDAGSSLQTEIRLASDPWPDEPRTRARALADRIESAWASRAALPLAQYADSLADIAAAGDQGQASADAVARAFHKLADSLDIPAARLGTRPAAAVYAAFARDSAARSLTDALRQTQPHVDALAALLDADLADVQSQFQLLHDFAPTNLDDRPLGNTTARHTRGIRDSLRARRAQLQSQLPAADPAAAADISRQLADLQPALDAADRALAPVDAAIAREQARLAAHVRLTAALRAGIAAWAQAHRRLADAADRRSPPRVDDLLAITREIRRLTADLRSSR